MAKEKEEKKTLTAVKEKKGNNNETKKVKKSQKKSTTKKSYVQEVKSELKKVKWPSKEEMLKYSIAVLIFIVIFGLYFYGLDALFAWISSLVKGL